MVTISAICQPPTPISRTTRSPTAMPTVMPATISTARLVRWPGATRSTTAAAIGAKYVLVWPNTSEATYQDTPTAIAICAIGTAARRSA